MKIEQQRSTKALKILLKKSKNKAAQTMIIAEQANTELSAGKTAVNKQNSESLILAQDKRWRRA